MSIIIKKSLPVIWAVGLVAGFMLNSCNNAGTGAGGLEEPVDLPKSSAPIMDSHINFYLDATGSIDWAFYFSAASQSLGKRIISMRMEETRKEQFFASLKTAVDQAERVYIRIIMALQVAEPLTTLEPPAFQPYIQLITDPPNIVLPEDATFPLQAFESKVDWHTFDCNHTLGQITDGKSEKPIVSCQEAVAMIKKWQELQSGKITAQLYRDSTALEAINPDKMKLTDDRVKYYTFGMDDARKINRYYQKSGEALHFYLHLGLFDEPGTVPMRTILHLDVKDLATEDFAQINESTYFEFAKPCPQYCDQ